MYGKVKILLRSVIFLICQNYFIFVYPEIAHNKLDDINFNKFLLFCHKLYVCLYDNKIIIKIKLSNYAQKKN